jgi:FkbM family methyltransferase
LKPDIPWIIRNKILHRSWRGAYHPLFEPEVKKLVASLSGDIFVDIGCNTGVYSKLAKKRFKRVYSIDPNPRYHAPIQVAISNYNGLGTFYLGDGMGSADSLVHNPHILGEDWVQKESYQVDVRTFDSLDLDADLVKIDVESGEFDVLNGMVKHLPRALVIELHDERREEELIAKMYRKGYSMSRIDETHWFFNR